MTKTFYTNVQSIGNKICFRGIRNGRKIRQKIDFRPTLYVPSNKPSEYMNLHGEFVEAIKPGDMWETRDFIKKYRDVSGFTIYGNQSFEYAFIGENYPGEIDWDISLLNIAILDIEVGSENGFPEPSEANEEITAITLKTMGKYYVFGCGEYTVNASDVEYVKCTDEYDLIKRFLDVWTLDYPDAISGWNIRFFDFPYLINRINKLYGEKESKRLSPWDSVSVREAFVGYSGRPQLSANIEGIAQLDYLELYRKFSPKGASQESYKLDAIAHVEIGERKLSYEEYGNLHKLYQLNYQKFIDYNIQDCRIVEKLDEKLKLFELALTLAYDSKTNFEDVTSQVRMWDAIAYNHLLAKKIVVPPKTENSKNAAYEGAYVKDPIIGMHKWVVSLDLNSLYPHLIMQYNLSPDCIVEPVDYNSDMRGFVANKINVDSFLIREIGTDILKKHGVTFTPNKQFFRVSQQGFLAEIMESMYDGRALYKNKATQAKKELESEKNPDKRIDIEKRIARYNNLQLAKKVSLNSAYGAMGSKYFRFFDIRIAEAVTLAGQLSIRWIEKALNEYMNRICKTQDKDYVIASDTDSIYLSFENLVNNVFKDTSNTVKIIDFMDKVCNEKIQSFIDESYDDLCRYMNGYAQKMKMKRESLADKAIWTAKKRYILNVHDDEGVRYAKPKLKIVGLEAIKSSTPSACRDKIKQALNIIMEKDEKALLDFIDGFRKEFYELSPEDIAFPRGVNGVKHYADSATICVKGTPIHVKGSLIYNHMVRQRNLEKQYQLIHEGEKIKFVYLREPNVFHSHVIAFPQMAPKEFELGKYIDYPVQFEKSFLEPLKIVLDSIGWQYERKSSLEAFFV